MASIGEVANQAGVSPATVSRFLNGQRVRSGGAIAAAIADLGYAPSAVARSLRSGVTRSIGVVVPDITNPFFAAAVKGIEAESRGQAYNIFLANTDESYERQNRVLEGLVGLVDALILTPVIESNEVPRALAQHAVPVVLLDREFGGALEFDSALADSAGGARQAARHLALLGHERIGSIHGPQRSTPGRLRFEGFLRGLSEAGVTCPPELVYTGDFRETSGYLGLKTLLALEDPPTAVFAANNLMAMGALRACKEAGVRFPDDLSFVSFDDFDLVDLLDPPITTVTRPTVEQGALAMSLLAARLAGNPPDRPHRCVLETSLSVRESSGVAPRRRSPVLS